MRSAPRSLWGSLWFHILIPRGAVLLGWLSINQLVQLPLPLIWCLIAADALFLIWTTRAHLQAADHHMTGSGAMAPVWGGYLLLFGLILAAFSVWWQALLVGNRLPQELSYSQQRRLEREAKYTLTLTEDGIGLNFEGEVTFGLTKRLAILLKEHPNVTRLDLSSPGGLIYEARGTAKLIQQHRLATTAQSLCASACTLIFAAGEHRKLGPQGSLGFHGYALETFGGLPQVDLQAEQAKDRDFLKSRGVSADFLDQIFATPAQDLWIPSIDVLQRSGLLTR